MDGKRPLNSGNREPNTPDATLLAPLNAATIGQFHQPYDNLSPHLLHPASASIHPFYDLIQQPSIPPHHLSLLTHGIPPFFPQLHPDPSQYNPMINTTALQPQGTSDAMGHPSEVELEIADEKRHRNTAASARFRVKKKHKTIALQRSVTDLSGRAEELEREAADLRKENSWLKEIVMLKGAQYAVNNRPHQDALRQSLVASGQIAFAPATVGGSEQEAEDGGEVQGVNKDNE